MRVTISLAVALLVFSTTLADDKKAKPAKPDKASFQTTVGRADSRLRVESEGETTIFVVTSEFGIDKATIKRLGDKWPKTILVRLRLRGLESFKAAAGDVAVEWAISSAEKDATRVSLWQGGKDKAITKDSPYYTEGRVVGKGKIPLMEGYFEVPLPAKLFEGNPREITLRWIDFYRG